MLKVTTCQIAWLFLLIWKVLIRDRVFKWGYTVHIFQGSFCDGCTTRTLGHHRHHTCPCRLSQCRRRWRVWSASRRVSVLGGAVAWGSRSGTYRPCSPWIDGSHPATPTQHTVIHIYIVYRILFFNFYFHAIVWCLHLKIEFLSCARGHRLYTKQFVKYTYTTDISLVCVNINITQVQDISQTALYKIF